jgi:hypothetical protein
LKNRSNKCDKCHSLLEELADVKLTSLELREENQRLLLEADNVKA